MEKILFPPHLNPLLQWRRGGKPHLFSGEHPQDDRLGERLIGNSGKHR